MVGIGGEADKVGNRYEEILTISILLKLAKGEYKFLEVEPSGEISKGIEFIATKNDGSREYYSSKRQRAAGEWSINALSKVDNKNTGRSVLGDLIEKLKIDNLGTCFFVSSTGANDLRELTECARKNETKDKFKAFLNQKLTNQFNEFSNKFSPGDETKAYEFLSRLHAVLVDENTFKSNINQLMNLMIYRPDMRDHTQDEVRALLGDYISNNLCKRIEQNDIWNYLKIHGYEQRDWTRDPSIREKVSINNCDYLRVIKSGLIKNLPLLRSETTNILEKINIQESKLPILVTAAAGMGKSCVLSQVIERLHNENIPVLVVRIDRHGDAHNTQELGMQLEFPRSPVIVLQGIANGDKSVLIIDQLDAVSEISGRYPKLWELFEALLIEAKNCPNMKIVLACRNFDIEHDYRLRKLKDSEKSNTIEIKVLEVSEVDEALESAGIKNVPVTGKQKELLRFPLTLYLYLSTIDHSNPSGIFNSVSDLFNQYWEKKKRIVDQCFGGQSDWTKVIDRLCEKMNENLSLSANRTLIDEWARTVDLMLTEHVLTIDGRQIRFFHELFFDYAFARNFIRKEQDVVTFLKSSEQHLFRRAQVRQILSYIRTEDQTSYSTQLRNLLNDPGIRFHIKKMVFAWLGSLPDPRIEEWRIVENLLANNDLTNHVLSPIRDKIGWFDLLDDHGIVENLLDSTDENLVHRGFWLLNQSEIKEKRSDRLALLLTKYVDHSNEWTARLQRYFQAGSAHHSRAIQELFLRLLKSNVFPDQEERNIDSWWFTIHYAVKDEPFFVIEAIACWLDMKIGQLNSDKEEAINALKQSENMNVIRDVSLKEPVHFFKTLLPRIEKIIELTKIERNDGLFRDEVWRYYSNIESDRISDYLITEVFRISEELAKNEPDFLEEMISHLNETESFTLTIMLLKAWSANPTRFSIKCIELISKDNCRLDVGYSAVFSHKCNPNAAITREAISKCIPHVSDDLRYILENLIIGYTPSNNNYENNDWHEKLLLEAFGQEYLSENGRNRLLELREKHPNQNIELPPKSSSGATWVVSPIPLEEVIDYTDDQWLNAMRTYNYGWESRSTLDGTAVELSRLLQPLVRQNRKRFITLFHRMEDSIREEYFYAILEGVFSPSNMSEDDRKKDDENLTQIDDETLMKLIRRAHELPGKKHGKSISEAFERIAHRKISNEDFDIIKHYGLDDEDPVSDEWWMKHNTQGNPSENAYTHGYNTVRGRASIAISNLFFADYLRKDYFLPVIKKLVLDKTIAVRICAIHTLLPLLNCNREKAVELFCILCDKNPIIIGSHLFEEFVRYSSGKHYILLRDTLLSGLNSTQDSAITSAARQICIASFTDVLAEEDASKVRSGSVVMRKAASQVYAHNLGESELKETCCLYVKHYFNDPDKEVRDVAAECFRHLEDVDYCLYEDVIGSYISSPAFPSWNDSLLRNLDDSKWKLPDITIKLAENFITNCLNNKDDENIRWNSDAEIISNLVVSLYTQTTESEVKSKCLDLIDSMELYGFYGIDKQLTEHDR